MRGGMVQADLSPHAQVLRSLDDAFQPSFFEYAGCVFLKGVASRRLYGAHTRGTRLARPWSPDRTGVEAFENHLHVLDRLPDGGIATRRSPSFRLAERYCRIVSDVWYSRLSSSFPGQRFRVYYIRGDNPSVRFHRVYRGEAPWLDPAEFASDIAKGHLVVLESPGSEA